MPSNHRWTCRGKAGTCRGRRNRAGLVAAGLAAALLCAGCGDDLAREFRAAAIGGVETGVNAIFDGLLNGLFTVADPDPNSTGSSTGTGTTS